MILEADGIKYRFHFWHRPLIHGRWVTHCKFHLVDETGKCVKGCPVGVPVLGSGEARCAEGDQFDKSRGRIIAMTRAFMGPSAPTLGASAPIPRETRRQLWTAYFNFVRPQKLSPQAETLRTLASAIKKVCPEVIPQIIAAIHPEDEFIRFLNE